LNPPYGRRAVEWLAKLATHGNGIALIFARTDTAMFHDHVFDRADALLFLLGRLTFHRPDGLGPHPHNSGGPSVLIAYGAENAQRLAACGLAGKFVELRRAVA
jgi:hypothetical protein